MPRGAFVIAVSGLACAVVVPLAGAGAGCGAPRDTPSLASRDAHRKIPAIKEAVDDKDRDAIPYLVAGLENDDPAVRMYSIEGLERLTGETKGYRFYADDDARRAAVSRWKRWLAGQPETDAKTLTVRPRDADDADDDADGSDGRGDDGGTAVSGGGGGGGGAGGIQ
jgi:hypothetical protein